jgi:hypothetical protein
MHCMDGVRRPTVLEPTICKILLDEKIRIARTFGFRRPHWRQTRAARALQGRDFGTRLHHSQFSAFFFVSIHLIHLSMKRLALSSATWTESSVVV